jgi:hypothetical protein
MVATICRLVFWLVVETWPAALRNLDGFLPMVPALAVAAVFPDSPRTSIAVAALAGLAPIDITSFVLLGKLLLYGLLALAVQYIPARWPRRHTATWPGARHLRRAIQR